MKSKVIFFDRDGVLNKSIVIKGKPKAPIRFKDFKIYKNLEKYFIDLKKEYLIYVVTNQPDFYKRKNRYIVRDMHNKLKKNLPIDKILCCFDLEDTSKNKKPNTGLVKKAFKKKKIDLTKSFVVGDRWRDIDLAYNLNCKSIFINRRYKEKLNKKPDYVCTTTIEAIKVILKK
jgi:D-glycero-D-manno-heptose 1,7-bisphosphate phosphatase